MKKIEFETSKGRFVVIDKNNDWCFGEKFNYYGANKYDAFNIKDINLCFSYSKSFKLSEITEEQASEIVESVVTDSYGKSVGFKNYQFEKHPFNYPILSTAIESLHSLLKSKGIHLFENPESHPSDIEPTHINHYDFLSNQWQQAEEKTFYNPYIFKL